MEHKKDSYKVHWIGLPRVIESLENLWWSTRKDSWFFNQDNVPVHISNSDEGLLSCWVNLCAIVSNEMWHTIKKKLKNKAVSQMFCNIVCIT